MRDRFWRIGSPAAARGSSGIALAYGLTIAVMVSALGHVWGGHFDPAVTLGALVARKISVPDAAVHWISRLAGGVVGGAAPDRRLRSRHPAGRRPRDAGARCRLTLGQRLTFEIVATFVLVLVVCATAIDSRGAFSVSRGCRSDS